MAASDVALALAESIIQGNITQVTVTSEVVVLRRPHEYLPLRVGPVTSVTSVAIGTDAALTAGAEDGYTVERFGVRRRYPYAFPAGAKVTVTYVTGWADAVSRPSDIAEALTLLETWLGTQPEIAVQSIKVGDETTTLAAQQNALPPAAAHQLLAKWVRPHA
jgi:hypothetical protein